RADTRASATRGAAEDRRACAGDDARTERRMALGSRVKRGAAKRHALVKRAAVGDFGGLADHHAPAVVDEDARADLRARMDLDAGQPAAEVRGEAPEPLQLMEPEPVRELVDVDRVQAWIAGQYLPRRAGRRVAVEDARDIAAQSREHPAILWVPD